MDDTLFEKKQSKVALLIDGDNASPKLLSKMLNEAGKYGSITIRRIFGDWTKANMTGWKDELNNFAIQPIQQFRYTVGKNATDSAMIIDAMDILHSSVVDCFCIISSDSDYTRLATRIREEGLFVIGIGEKKTPKPFVNACNVFIFTENLNTQTVPKKTVTRTNTQDGTVTIDKELQFLLQEAFEMAVRDDGWANLSSMGTHLHQLDPGFDPRTYGFGQLSQLIKRSNMFLLNSKDEGDSTAVYVKLKES